MLETTKFVICAPPPREKGLVVKAPLILKPLVLQPQKGDMYRANDALQARSYDGVKVSVTSMREKNASRTPNTDENQCRQHNQYSGGMH